MAERKQYDLFANMLSNTQSSIYNLITSGLSIDNTSLLDRSVYENNDKVREAFKDKYGLFDKTRFDAFYNDAKVYYNYLSLTDFNKAMQRLATFHRDNISVEPEKRRLGSDFMLMEVSNPYLITQGIITPGLYGERTKSEDEIMLANKVLLNPTTAGKNLENAKWGDSPNDNFWGYFFNTLVLARYNTAGTHKDPITGLIVSHEAGQLKLDDTGNFYYELLDGRDIYDKKVLNKMNVLTVDGSWANELDFFDSDGLELKSAVGSIMKNLALVGTMFLRYVGPWVAGLSIATLLAGLFGTLGKMAVGSDSPTLSALEGWSKSMNRLTAVTEYAQLHPWCLENMINLVGDVMGLLREQRIIFEKVPSIFKGASQINSVNEKARLAELEAKHLKLIKELIANLEKNGVKNTDLINTSAILQARATSAAQAEMDSFIKGYTKLGEIISRGYMTAITVGDTYGEAKAAGASDRDATLLTLGYAIGEYQLLKTGLGRWNIPETRLDKYRNLAIAKALYEAKGKISSIGKDAAVTKEGKKNYVRRLLNAGKNAAKDIWAAEKANGKRTAAATLTSAAGEGVEEVSEELLADFSKGCYDVVKWLQGEDTRLNTFGYNFEKNQWDSSEVLNRYGLSLVGGTIGGGLTNIATNYRTIDSYNGMGREQAIQLLIYMARNGGIDEFMRDISKMQIDDPNLSNKFEVIDHQTVWNPGTRLDNRDLDIKKAILDLVNIIQSILSANGAVSDNQFLDAQTLRDLRFSALYNSTTAGAYILEYNNLLYDLVKATVDLKELAIKELDTNNSGIIEDSETTKKALEKNKELSKTTQEAIKNKEKEIKEIKLRLDDLVSGKRSVEFLADALWETTTFLSGDFTLPIYAEKKYGKKFKDLNDEEISRVKEEYKKWKTSEARDKIHKQSQMFLEFLKLFSQVVKTYTDDYLNTSLELLQIAQYITKANEDLTILSEVNKDFFISLLLNLVATPTAKTTDNRDYQQLSLQAYKLANLLIPLLSNEADKAKLEKLNSDKELTVKEFAERTKQELDSIDDPEIRKIRQKELQEHLDSLISAFNLDITTLVYDNLYKNLHEYVQTFVNRGFINRETKNQLVNLLTQMRNITASVYTSWETAKKLEELKKEKEAETGEVIDINTIELPWDWDEENPAIARQNLLFTDIQAIEKLDSTPLEKNLNEFSISISGKPLNITQLIDKVNASFNLTSANITNFLVADIATELVNAIQTMELYLATIKAARTDNASLNNLFGFNATLNEASAKVEGAEKLNLAEIDKTVADLFIEDINNNLSKLKLLLRLYKINQGQKLSKLDRVSARKDLLIYKRMKYIVSILDKLDDWDENSKILLKAIVESLHLHEDMLNHNDNIVKDDETFQKENLTLENAVYNFFLTNKDVLSDPNKLALLINPKNLDLYTEAKELLNEGLEALDDNSFVYWLASRAALKAQDFYYQYKQIINPEAKHPLAPIATQELAIYNNYASIVNGSVFDTFYNAMRLAIINDWQVKSVEQRKEVLKKLNKSEDFAKEEYTKYAINFLPVPRYSNIVFTEGVPGSGNLKYCRLYEESYRGLEGKNGELCDGNTVLNSEISQGSESV